MCLLGYYNHDSNSSIFFDSNSSMFFSPFRQYNSNKLLKHILLMRSLILGTLISTSTIQVCLVSCCKKRHRRQLLVLHLNKTELSILSQYAHLKLSLNGGNYQLPWRHYEWIHEEDYISYLVSLKCIMDRFFMPSYFFLRY